MIDRLLRAVGLRPPDGDVERKLVRQRVAHDRALHRGKAAIAEMKRLEALARQH